MLPLVSFSWVLASFIFFPPKISDLFYFRMEGVYKLRTQDATFGQMLFSLCTSTKKKKGHMPKGRKSII
jgi:hypothetical protein